MTLKELKEICQALCLPVGGSKAKFLKLVKEFKLLWAMNMETEVAKTLFLEQQRQPVNIKVPNLPWTEEQEQHYLTLLPLQSWCEACLASRRRKNVHKTVVHDHGPVLIQIDFGHSSTSDNGDVEKVEGAGEPN